MAAALQVEKMDRPELAKHDSSILGKFSSSLKILFTSVCVYLDLVFVMDCTSSMGSYIASAIGNIRSIVEEIVVSEKSDIRLALVEYRDHPPQVRWNQIERETIEAKRIFIRIQHSLHVCMISLQASMKWKVG